MRLLKRYYQCTNCNYLMTEIEYFAMKYDLLCVNCRMVTISRFKTIEMEIEDDSGIDRQTY